MRIASNSGGRCYHRIGAESVDNARMTGPDSSGRGPVAKVPIVFIRFDGPLQLPAARTRPVLPARPHWRKKYSFTAARSMV